MVKVKVFAVHICGVFTALHVVSMNDVEDNKWTRQ